MADRPTERRRLDQMTDDDLDALYERAERAEGEHAELRRLRDQWQWRARDTHRIARLQRERAERAEQQAANVRSTLAEVLAQFTHNTHPGRPCKQTGHVNVATIDRWHAALGADGQPDRP